MRREVFWLLIIVAVALVVGVLLDVAFWLLLRSTVPVFMPTQLPTI